MKTERQRQKEQYEQYKKRMDKQAKRRRQVKRQDASQPRKKVDWLFWGIYALVIIL